MPDQLTAVITGTSTGFGNLAALRFANAGYRVFGTMRDTASRNAQAKKDLEAHGITVVEMDVTNDASVDAAAATILAAAGHVDVLVNNAGTAHMGVAEAFTPASVTQQYATNVVGPLRVARAFLPGMRKQKSGLVVFVSSVVGRFTLPFIGIYAGTKWAIEAIAESMSYELRPFGVDVSIVQPGAYATNIFSAMITPDDPDRVASYGDVAKIFDQLGGAMASSAGDPAEVADGILAIAKLPAGKRPLRTSVPVATPTTTINEATAPIQRGILEAYGLSALLPEAPVAV